jgi:hypothetical protein
MYFADRVGILATTEIWPEKIQIKKEEKNAIQFN